MSAVMLVLWTLLFGATTVVLWHMKHYGLAMLPLLLAFLGVLGIFIKGAVALIT